MFDDDRDPEDLNDLFTRISEEMAKFIKTSMEKGEIPFNGSFAGGFKINIGPDGLPEFSKIGKHDIKQFSQNQWEKAQIDFFTHEDHVEIIADMPGIENEEEVDIKFNNGNIMIQAKHDDIKYRNGIKTKIPLKEDALRFYVKNGVLVIQIDKA